MVYISNMRNIFLDEKYFFYVFLLAAQWYLG